MEKRNYMSEPDKEHAGLYFEIMTYEEKGRDCVNIYFPDNGLQSEIDCTLPISVISSLFTSLVQQLGVKKVLNLESQSDTDKLPGMKMLEQMGMVAKEQEKLNSAMRSMMNISMEEVLSILQCGIESSKNMQTKIIISDGKTE